MGNSIAQNDVALLPEALEIICNKCDQSRYHCDGPMVKDKDGNPVPMDKQVPYQHYSGYNRIGVYLAEKDSPTTELAGFDFDPDTNTPEMRAFIVTVFKGLRDIGINIRSTASKTPGHYHSLAYYNEPQPRDLLDKRVEACFTDLGLYRKGHDYYGGQNDTPEGFKVEIRGAKSNNNLTLIHHDCAPALDVNLEETSEPWKASEPLKPVHQPSKTTSTTAASKVTPSDAAPSKFKKPKDFPELLKPKDLIKQGEEFDPEGRDNDAYKVACALYDMGVSEDIAKGIMLAKLKITKQVEGKDPFTEADCLKCFKSGYIKQQTKAENDHIKAKQEVKKQAEQERLSIVSISETLQKDIKPIEWVISDVLPNGYAMLVGAPKKGKSFLALDLAVNIAGGTPFLGEYEVNQQGVLYLALEDSERRIKQRVEAMKLDEIPGGLLFAYEARDIENGLIEQLKAALEQRPDIGVIIIDTLAKVWPANSVRGSVYYAEYKLTDKLKRLANDTGRTVLVIHHENKKGSDESIDAVSGSHGVAGTADTIMRLIRHEGHTNATLKVVSRDADADQSLSIINDGGFKMDTDPLVITNEKQAGIFQHILEHGPKTPKQVTADLKMKYGSVKVWMMRLKESGHLIPKSGKYDAAEEFKNL